jgi:hypothetical protein
MSQLIESGQTGYITWMHLPCEPGYYGGLRVVAIAGESNDGLREKIIR